MKGRSGGFTLLEVLLALFIGSLVLSSIYGVFASLSNTTERLETAAEQFHQVRILTDRLGGELGSLSHTTLADQSPLVAATDSLGRRYLEFSSELVSPLLQPYGAVARVRYELREEEGEHRLYRSESLLLSGWRGASEYLLMSGVENFQLRFRNAGSWSDEWTDAALPQLLELSFELQVDGRPLPFRSSFALKGSG